MACSALDCHCECVFFVIGHEKKVYSHDGFATVTTLNKQASTHARTLRTLTRRHYCTGQQLVIKAASTLAALRTGPINWISHTFSGSGQDFARQPMQQAAREHHTQAFASPRTSTNPCPGCKKEKATLRRRQVLRSNPYKHARMHGRTCR